MPCFLEESLRYGTQGDFTTDADMEACHFLFFRQHLPAASHENANTLLYLKLDSAGMVRLIVCF
ncbi:hypothetical protein DCM91_17585 [Chitinophaga costaii]|nr:hypothetical protein DCM91_17585 [Chitinophaga costaii]